MLSLYRLNLCSRQTVPKVIWIESMSIPDQGASKCAGNSDGCVIPGSWTLLNFGFQSESSFADIDTVALATEKFIDTALLGLRSRVFLTKE